MLLWHIITLLLHLYVLLPLWQYYYQNNKLLLWYIITLLLHLYVLLPLWFYYYQKDLPLLPADRSDFDVHWALLDDMVQKKSHTQRFDTSYQLLCLSLCSVYYSHYDSYLYYLRTINFTWHISILFIHSPLFSWSSGQHTWHWSRWPVFESYG